MQLLAGKFCKSRGSECEPALCLQSWLGPQHSLGRLAHKGIFLQEDGEGAAAWCGWSLLPSSPPPRVCMSVPAWDAQQLEKHNGQQLRNWKILSCFSLPCFSVTVSPGVCLGPFPSGRLHCTLISYTGCPVTIQSQ